MTNTETVGVIIGRFQVNSLHDGHRYLIDKVIKKHKKILILVGVSPVKDKRNPLSFEDRKYMIKDIYHEPNVKVLPVVDVKSDIQWSKDVDKIIGKRKARLYCSRTGFKSRYFGKHKVVNIKSTGAMTGSEMRKLLGNSFGFSRDFRYGIIHHVMNQHDTGFATVDVAIMKGDKILLGQKKEDNGKWRFIGGFYDVKDITLEETAIREVREETGLVVRQPEYICSAKIDDWRYRGSNDGIITTFFKVRYGRDLPPKAGDDINKVKWFKLSDVDKVIIEEHRELLSKLKGEEKNEE